MPSALKTTGPITRPKSSVCGVPTMLGPALTTLIDTVVVLLWVWPSVVRYVNWSVPVKMAAGV